MYCSGCGLYRLFLGVIYFLQFVEEKPPDNVQFQQLLENRG